MSDEYNDEVWRYDAGMTNNNTADAQPSELTELSKLTHEFLSRLQTIENELETLKEDKKTLFDEFADKLDIKTLLIAQRVVKIEAAVQHRDTYDAFSEILRDPTT